MIATQPLPASATPSSSVMSRATRTFTSSRRTALVLAVVIALASALRADAACTIDIGGNDDGSGGNQTDASQFCNNGACNVSDLSFAIAFDDRNWTGGNTGDGCLLFDSDGDGNANRAICGTLTGAGALQAGSPTCYTCGDTRPDRCTSGSLVACTSTCTVTVTNDPFVGAPTHAQANDCNGTQCLLLDTSITCCVTTADRGGASGVLLDACSYNSQQPNSNPVDCIITRACGNDPNDPVCNDTNPCTVDTCDTSAGVCNHVPGNADATCRVGAGVCDVAETCTGTSSECPADGFAQSGVCRPADGACDVAESCNGSGVDCPADGVAQGGVCRPAVDECDQPESCDGVNKTCPTDAFQPNNTPCSDDNACSTGDVCVGGACTPSGSLNCDDNEVCTDDDCDPASGCTHVDNSDPCSDGSECTTNDACSGGSCVGGPAPNCEDNNVCTDDDCDPNVTGGCTHTNNTDPCSDGSDCTTNDACSGGSCVGGPPPNCDDGIFCTTDSCPDAGGCDHDPVGGPCCDSNADCGPDADECTINERCENNQCVSSPRVCNDSNDCTDDSCNPSTPGGCVFDPNNDPCSDGSECTTNDACSSGSCVGGPAPNCEDNNVCTDDDCDPNVTGGCTHSNNTAPCADGSECTTNDACSGGSCVGGPAPNCEDGNVCTDDDCDPNVPGGCTHSNNTGPCTDNDGCTLNDACGGGTCHSGTQKTCEDANICTDDTCSSPSGTCVFTPNDDPCEDGDVCTLNDACFNGDCEPGPRDPCNDHLACTNDFCTSPAIGCENPPVTQPCCETDEDCIDESGCTIDEACVNNACVSTPRDCDDEDPCTLDSCTSQSADDFLCVNANCEQLQGQPCPEDHPECIHHTCGNTIPEPEDGETCDPPGSTTTPSNSTCGTTGACGNVCQPGCTYCGDGIAQTPREACDDGNTVTGCDLVHPQKAADECQNDCTIAMCKDPAKITLTDWIDRYDVHGMLPASELVDFGARTLVVELRNARGKVLYRTALEAGSLVGDVAVGKFKYKNKSAKAWGGLAAVKISRHRDGYRLTATTYGNLYNSRSEMVTNVYSGSDHWSVRGNWSQTKRGWKFKE